jgi:hypothetical protein
MTSLIEARPLVSLSSWMTIGAPLRLVETGVAAGVLALGVLELGVLELELEPQAEMTRAAVIAANSASDRVHFRCAFIKVSFRFCNYGLTGAVLSDDHS